MISKQIIIATAIVVVAIAVVGTIIAVSTDNNDPDKQTYVVTFTADGKDVKEVEYNEGDSVLPSDKIPSPPAKNGYTAKWSNYSLKDRDISVQAIYEPIVYTAKFVDTKNTVTESDDSVVSTRTFTVETKALSEPIVPSKDGYNVSWEKYTLGTGDITVKSIYKIITYKAKFIDTNGTATTSDDREYTRTFDVNTKTLSAPSVPTKEGYNVSWE